MNKLWHYLSLRLIVIGVLYCGLLVLYVQGKAEPRFLGIGAVFSVLIILGCLMEHLFNYRGDRFILPAIQLLTVIGLVFLTRINSSMAWQQFIWAIIGVIVFYVVLWGLRDYRQLARIQYLWALVAVLLLFVTLLFGITAGGARSWLRIGGLGFETEELVKVVLLIFLSIYLVNHEELLRVGTIQWGKISLPDWRTLGPFLLMAAFSLGILAAQKSLGTALIFYLLFVLMLYVTTERKLYLGVALPVLLGTGLLGYALFGHVRVRVAVWLNPWQDVSGGGYQIAQSLFAISGGGIFGTGLGNGIGAFQVPTASTDFIFSVIAEEIGFAGAMALTGVFLFVVLRCFIISCHARERLGQIMAAGIGIIIAVETLVILAGVTKLLPLTGIPLPWVSYGGSSMLVHYLLLGLLANISRGSTLQARFSGIQGKEQEV